jgi:hypothetical protein
MTRKWKICISTVAVLVVAFPILSHFQKKMLARSIRRSCVNNMVEIGIAGRVWAEDHGGRFPTNIIYLSNELSAPKLLCCPADPIKRSATNFTYITADNISYELLAPGLAITNTNTVVYRCMIHGMLGYADRRIEGFDKR